MIYRKNKKVGILSFVYCISTILFLMLSLSLITSSNGYKVETWQDYAAFDFEQEVAVDDNGEEVVTNLISTPEQLAGFFAMQSEDEKVHADSHSTYFTSANSYKLKNNIDLSGKSWSPSNNSSTLDGMSFTIKNLSISSSSANLGFVATNSGTIKNVVFENCNISSSNGSAVIGIVASKNSGTIESVTIVGGTVKATASGTRKVGGIVGENSKTIKECSNSATVSQGSYVGGIAGHMSGGTITNCYNYGSISAGTNSTTRMGGIVGYLSSGTLKLCLNYGTVSDSFTASSEISAGGVVGYSIQSITECGNTANVRAGNTSTNATYVGGVVGYTTKEVTYCYNKGSVIGYAKQKTSSKEEINKSCGKLFADGVGYFWAYKIYMESGIYTSSAWNDSGKYKTTKNSSYKYYTYYDNYVGGVVGKCSSTITSCYNKGTVSTSNTKKTQYYDLYFKWRAQRNTGADFILLIHQNISFTIGYTSDNIANTTSSINYSYYSNSLNLPRSVSISQVYNGNSGKTKSMSLSDWTKNVESRSNNWFLEDFDGGSFNTYHNIDASSVGYIYLKAHYKSEYNEKSETTYYSIYTGSYYKTYTSKGTANINLSGLNQGSNTKYAQDSNINGGDPYLTGLYW